MINSKNCCSTGFAMYGISVTIYFSSWNNLDDLQKWLMIREVEYTFQSHERYKGATYHGKWNAGMPHIW